MDFRIGLVMLAGVGIGLQVVRVCMDDNPSVTGLMLVHKDRAACHN